MNTEFFDSAITRAGPRSLSCQEVPQLIIQGHDTKICGPVCAAMALYCFPTDILARMNSTGGSTRTKQLVSVLKEYYGNVDDKLVKFDGLLNKCAILKVIIKNRKVGHWVLLWKNGFIYDPSWGCFLFSEWKRSVVTYGWRITSSLGFC